MVVFQKGGGFSPSKSPLDPPLSLNQFDITHEFCCCYLPIKSSSFSYSPTRRYWKNMFELIIIHKTNSSWKMSKRVDHSWHNIWILLLLFTLFLSTIQLILQGLNKQSEIGLLLLFEHYQSCMVSLCGPVINTPVLPHTTALDHASTPPSIQPHLSIFSPSPLSLPAYRCMP